MQQLLYLLKSTFWEIFHRYINTLNFYFFYPIHFWFNNIFCDKKNYWINQKIRNFYQKLWRYMNVFIKEQSIRTCKSKFKGYTWQKLQDLGLSSFLSSYLIPSDHASSLSIHVNPATNKTISERCIFLKEKNHKSKWTIHQYTT